METPAPNGLRSLAWRLFRILALAYLGFLLLISSIERFLVYPAPRFDADYWQGISAEQEDIWFNSSDGTQLHGWLYEHPSPQHYVVYFHGNGEDVSHNIQYMKQLSNKLEATIFIFDYRGYGKSEGKPVEVGVVADGLAAHTWFADRMGIATDEVVLMGRSLGGGVAAAAAAEQGAKALVIQSTFASMVDIAARMYPILPVRLVMKNRYDSIERMANYQGPVLQSHGTADRIVPFSEGKRLFDSISHDNKQFFEYSYGHNEPLPNEYFELLVDFLGELDSAPAAAP